jgi:ATP-dependent Clp protease adapter protein ClpS
VSEITMPGVDADREIAGKIGDLFDGHHAVVIIDSDFTTFAEVEMACIALFGYTADAAAALALRVHTTGEAVAAVMAEAAAHAAVRELRRRNVLARVDPV